MSVEGLGGAYVRREARGIASPGAVTYTLTLLMLTTQPPAAVVSLWHSGTARRIHKPVD